METNGRGSSRKQTRHIAVRYFFITDQEKSKEIRIEYCPTGIMIADYFTKQLQGLRFRQLWDMIMGNTDISLFPCQLIKSASPHTRQVEFEMCQHNRNPGVCWERKWRLVHLPLLSIYCLSVTRRQAGPRANTYALVRIHAPRYWCQSMRATPGCTCRTFPLITTRRNIRRRIHQH
jgi:hypothetical protein